MKYIVLTALGFFSVTAMAGFTGEWEGPAIWNSLAGDDVHQTQCKVHFDITQTETTLRIDGGKIQCGGGGVTFNPITYTIVCSGNGVPEVAARGLDPSQRFSSLICGSNSGGNYDLAEPGHDEPSGLISQHRLHILWASTDVSSGYDMVLDEERIQFKFLSETTDTVDSYEGTLTRK